MQLEATAGIQAVQFGGAFGLFVDRYWSVSHPLVATMSDFSTFDAALSDAQLHNLMAAYAQGGDATGCTALFVVKGMKPPLLQLRDVVPLPLLCQLCSSSMDLPYVCLQLHRLLPVPAVTAW